jgi:hypothetical protein
LNKITPGLLHRIKLLARSTGEHFGYILILDRSGVAAADDFLQADGPPILPPGIYFNLCAIPSARRGDSV